MGELLTGYGLDQRDEADVIDETSAQYLTFGIGEKIFAVGILKVNEIIEVSRVTALPMMPEFVRGVINLRGEAVPVVDLAARIAERATEINKRSCIVLVDVQDDDDEEGHAVGMLVDGVREIVEISESALQPAPDLGEDFSSEFVVGMGRVGEGFVVLLDVNHMLSTEQVKQLGRLKKVAEPEKMEDVAER
jgi:purine-binding chemotaxis protein CheW